MKNSALILVAGILSMLCTSCQFSNKEFLTGFPMTMDSNYADPGYPHEDVLNVLVLPLENSMESDFVSRYSHDIVLSALRNFGKFNYFNVHYDAEFFETAGPLLDMETGYIDRIALGETGRVYNSDAVLRISIAEYRPFPPMRMKIKAWLVDTQTAERVWAFDHVFDMDDTAVVNAFKLWWNREIEGGDHMNRYSVSRVRPSMFHNFVFHSMAKSYEQSRIHNARAVAQMRAKQRAKERKQAKQSCQPCVEVMR